MQFPHLLVASGPDKNKTFVIHEGTGHMLGRHQEAMYKLTDMRVSRFHCQVLVEGKTVTVTDNGSSGGVRVNGTKVDSKSLRHGDTIQIGETILRFVAHPEGEDNDATVQKAKISAGAEYDPKATDQLADLSGRTLTHYEIGDVLGKGSSSMVFRAVDTQNGATVALKVMQPAFAKNEDDRQRFVRAMKSMLPLKHPNLVELLSAGKSGPYCWAAMELVEGENLTDVIRRIGIAGMLEWKHAFRVAVHIGRALAYAHGEGIIHRDIAPSNMLVRSADKVVKLGDLMLAKALEGNLAENITQPGVVVGDPHYLSPERSASDATAVDERSDLFSLGATCYALLTGKSPFAGSNLLDTLIRIRTMEPLKPSTFQMGIPSAFEGVILKLLAKKPEDRYQSAASLVAELERIGKFNGFAV